MTVHAFTSFSFSYLNRARVLIKSLRKLHPDWIYWAVITDVCPDTFQVNWDNTGFDYILNHDELIREETDQWLFGHNVVEACTAVKGAAAVKILSDPSCSKLLYFDPDIAVFNSMSEVVNLLDRYSIVLTPHQTCPTPRAQRQAILDNEVCSLMHGSFNLGFIALQNSDEGVRFARWWDERLRDWCYDRKDIGIFVDQKWCDLVPCFFDDVKILRDPGYNVASWNLAYRKLTFDNKGCALVNSRPLRFFHFTKLGAVGDSMTRRYARDNFEIYELWAWYKTQVNNETEDGIPLGYWRYGVFDNGEEVPDAARRLYRDRVDLRAAFPKPLLVLDGFYGWLGAETDLLTNGKSCE